MSRCGLHPGLECYHDPKCPTYIWSDEPVKTIELDFPTKQDLCDEIDRLAEQKSDLIKSIKEALACLEQPLNEDDRIYPAMTKLEIALRRLTAEQAEGRKEET